MGFRRLLLLLPQAGEAGGRAQFPGFGFLAARNVESLVETRFGFRLIVWRVLQEKFAFEPVQLRPIEPLLGSLDKSQRLSHRCKSFLGSATLPRGLGQQGEKLRPQELSTRSPVACHSLAELAETFHFVRLLGQRPSPKNSSLCQPERKALLGRQNNGGLGPVQACLPLTAHLMEPGSPAEGICQTKRVRQFLGEC